MDSPASYTFLGVALSLGLLSLVGLGGVNYWYLYEQQNGGDSSHGASALCQSTASDGDPLSVGADLVLSQEAGADRVTVTGLLVGGGVSTGNAIRLRLSSDTSCIPIPTNFKATTTVTPTNNGFAAVDWTVGGVRLDGSGDDITGDTIVFKTPSGQTSGCCLITALPGSGTNSR